MPLFRHVTCISKALNIRRNRKWNPIMPSKQNINTNDIQNLARPASIRDELEKRAWLLHPGLTKRLANRLRRREAHMTSCERSSHRVMRWQDRTLLALGVVIVLFFLHHRLDYYPALVSFIGLTLALLRRTDWLIVRSCRGATCLRFIQPPGNTTPVEFRRQPGQPPGI